MMKNLNMEEFIKELSSNSPAPGGGSAAALSASMAASLSSMVFNLTIGKKAYLQMEEEERALVDRALIKCMSLKDEFLNMMEKDAEAFLELMSYFKLPKETEEEKSFRKQKINEGYIGAMRVPFELAEKTLDLYHYILIAGKYGNINAISDAGVAALLNQTALEGAILNVKINLSAIEDKEFREKKILECDDMIKTGENMKSEIMNLVNSKI
jgi:methenyltetrahydrofolate cyclohydrolase